MGPSSQTDMVCVFNPEKLKWRRWCPDLEWHATSGLEKTAPAQNTQFNLWNMQFWLYLHPYLVPISEVCKGPNLHSVFFTRDKKKKKN